jgi:hypothetical protein
MINKRFVLGSVLFNPLNEDCFMKKLMFTLLIWLQVGVVQAAGVSSEQAQNFLHYSGLNHMIDELPGMFQQQFNMDALAESDAKSKQQMHAALASALAEVQGNSLALAYLTSEADASSMQKILAFLESPLGKRIMDAENAMNTPEGQAQMQQYLAQMAKNPPPAGRAKLLDQLRDALQLEQLMIGMSRDIFFSSIEIAREIKPEKVQGMEQMWGQLESMMRAQMQQMATASVYYTYRDLSDRDLIDYAAFMQSADGKAYLTIGTEIANRYVTAMTSAFMRHRLDSK